MVLDNLVYGHKNVVKNILKVPLIVDQVGNREILKQILLGKHAALINTTHENKPIEAEKIRDDWNKKNNPKCHRTPKNH